MELNFIKSGDNIVLNLPTDGVINNEFFQGSSLSNIIKITFTYETTSEDATVSIFPMLKLIRPDNIKIGPRTYDPSSFETEIDGTNTILSWEFTLQEMDLAVDGVAWFAFPFSYRATSTSANTIKSTGAVSATVHKSVIVENTAIVYDDSDVPTVIANLLTSITNVVADLAGNYYTKAQTIRKYEVTDTTGNTNLLALFDTLTIPGTYYINWYVDENNVVYSVKLDITAGENTIFRQTATYQSTYNGYETTKIMTRSQDLDISDWTEPFTTRYELYDSERNKVGYVNEDGTIDYVNTAISFAAKCDEAIARGDALQITGTTGIHITVKKAVYSEIVENPHLLIGLADETASANNNLKVKMVGNVEGLNTSSLTEGSELYLSTSVAGGITTTKPTNGNIAISIGMCFKNHLTQGIISVAVKYSKNDKYNLTFESQAEFNSWINGMEEPHIYSCNVKNSTLYSNCLVFINIVSAGIEQSIICFSSNGMAFQTRTFESGNPGEFETSFSSTALNTYFNNADTDLTSSDVQNALVEINTKVNTNANVTYFDSLAELITWQDSLETAGVYYGILEEKDVFRYIVEITSTGNIRQVREQFTTAGEAYGYDFPAAIIQQRTFASGTGSGVSWSQVLAEQPNVYLGDWDTLEKPGIYFAPTFLNGRYDMTYLQVGQRIGDTLDTKIYQIAFSWHPQRQVVIWLFREFEPGMGAGVAWSNEKWLAETPLQVSGVPTAATKGYYIGQLCVNTTTSDTYILLGWNGENSYTSTEFTWVQVALGSYLPLTGGTILNDLVIGGNLTVNGTTTTVDTTNIEIADKLIVIAKNNTVALTTPAGILAKKYDGTNDGALVFDNTGTAKVGDVVLDINGNIDVANSDLQTLATRSETIVDGNLVEFDTTLNQIVDSGKKISDYLPTTGGTLTGNLYTQSIIPTATATYDLGSPTYRFNYLYSNYINAAVWKPTTGNGIALASTILYPEVTNSYDLGAYANKFKDIYNAGNIYSGTSGVANYIYIGDSYLNNSTGSNLTIQSVNSLYLRSNNSSTYSLIHAGGFLYPETSSNVSLGKSTNVFANIYGTNGYFGSSSVSGQIYLGNGSEIRGNTPGDLIISSASGRAIYFRPNNVTTSSIVHSLGAFYNETRNSVTLGTATYPFGATHHGALSIYDSTGALTNEIKAPLASLFNTLTGVSAGGLATGSLLALYGHSAGLSLTTGSYNTFIGATAGVYITTGSNIVAIGQNAGSFIADGTTQNQTSSASIYIGNNTHPLLDGDTNEIVIGHGATGHGSNTQTYGNSSTTDTYIYGNLHLDTKALSGVTDITMTGKITDGTNNYEVESIWGSSTSYGTQETENLSVITKAMSYYASDTASGLPNSSYSWFVTHQNNPGGTATAVQTAIADSSTTLIYQRNKVGSSWGSWVQIYPVVDSGWQTLTLTDLTSTDGIKYRKVGNLVEIEGVFANLTEGGLYLGTLPSGYRPARTRGFMCTGFSGSETVVCNCRVYTNGQIYIGLTLGETYNSAWEYCISFSFLAD